MQLWMPKLLASWDRVAQMPTASLRPRQKNLGTLAMLTLEAHCCQQTSPFLMQAWCHVAEAQPPHVTVHGFHSSSSVAAGDGSPLQGPFPLLFEKIHSHPRLRRKE